MSANIIGDIEVNDLRWRKDGRFQGPPCFETQSCMEHNAEMSKVFECFQGGAYLEGHAIMNLIVRGTNYGTTLTLVI